MDVKDFEKNDTHSRASSFSDTSFSSVHERSLALKPVIETPGEADCRTVVDSKSVMEFSAADDARQKKQLQFSEKRLQVVFSDLKEDAYKEVTMLGNKMTVVANVISAPNVSAISLHDEVCVTNLEAIGSLGPIEKGQSSDVQASKNSDIKFDTQSLLCSQPLSFPSAQGDNVGQIHTIATAMDKETSANLIRASDADFISGQTDNVMVNEGKDQHTGTEQRAIPFTQVKLVRGKKGGFKRGRWTRLRGRVGMDNLQDDNSTSSGKRNFPGTFKAMVEDYAGSNFAGFNSFMELAWKMLMVDHCHDSLVALMGTIAWRLWGNRNEVRHEGKRLGELELCHDALIWLLQFQEATEPNAATELVQSEPVIQRREDLDFAFDDYSISAFSTRQGRKHLFGVEERYWVFFLHIAFTCTWLSTTMD
nr:hypothetical protein CFP56_59590 [Quercus suber]